MSTRIMMTFLVAAAVVATSVSSASAGIITTHSGNTQQIGAGFAPHMDGTVNFAVFNKTGGGGNDTWNTSFATFDTAAFSAGTGSGALDTSAAFLYVYQVVNDGTDTRAISAIAQSVGNSVTSWGSWATLGLFDGSGDVGSSNPFGTPSGFAATPASASVGANDGIGSIVTLGTAGTNPAAVTNSGGIFRAEWSNNVPANLASGISSSLIGFTSNLTPGFAAHSVFDAGSTSSGLAASPVPEPSTLVLLGIGALCGIPGLRRRSKKKE